jgi:hypothetical protein
MKVWITKYALTTGIFEAEGRVCVGVSLTMIEVAREGSMSQHFHGDDWHDNPESAKRKAEQMRIKRIASLKKQISTLENLKF